MLSQKAREFYFAKTNCVIVIPQEIPTIVSRFLACICFEEIRSSLIPTSLENKTHVVCRGGSGIVGAPKKSPMLHVGECGTQNKRHKRGQKRRARGLRFGTFEE